MFAMSAANSFRPMVSQPIRHSSPETAMLTRTRRLSLFSKSTSDEDNSSAASSSTGTSVRFLGRGKNAIVRPGVVLVAPPDEFHHFLREAAVFIYAMGHDEDDEYVIRGAIIDHPTPFTIHEMLPADSNAVDANNEATAEFLQNLMYRGGELGDAVFMLHSDPKLGDQAKQEMIGGSGVFQGGMEYAVNNEYAIDPQKVKFFFQYMEFTEVELEEMLENREEESTQWVSVEVPPDFVLSNEWDRGEAWARLRNAVRDK